MQPATPLITLSPTSPSFKSLSSDIAARVVREFSNDPDFFLSNDPDLFPWTTSPPEEQHFPEAPESDVSQENQEAEFEFAVVRREADGYHASSAADDIFYNGQIRAVYPLFDTSLISDDADKNREKSSPSKPKRPQLRELFGEERDTSCSSSEADELDGVSPGTYCVWTPNKSEKEKTTSGRCKKSRSTGTFSKRWKIKDLLYRSNSDGKETFVFLTPSNKKGSSKIGDDDDEEEEKGKKKMKEMKDVVCTGKQHHQKNKEEDVRRHSYLPYREDLVGILS